MVDDVKGEREAAQVQSLQPLIRIPEIEQVERRWDRWFFKIGCQVGFFGTTILAAIEYLNKYPNDFCVGGFVGVFLGLLAAPIVGIFMAMGAPAAELIYWSIAGRRQSIPNLPDEDDEEGESAAVTPRPDIKQAGMGLRSESERNSQRSTHQTPPNFSQE